MRRKLALVGMMLLTVCATADEIINDPMASITRCGYVLCKVADTTDEYVYVFTNTVNVALGIYARFEPSVNMKMIGAFGIGGGGAGGAGGGGGGGGSAFAITNSMSFNIGEEIMIQVGVGGEPSGYGGILKAIDGRSYSYSGNGRNSYLRIRQLGSSGTVYTEYCGWGGGRGGNWRDGAASGTTVYVQGGNGTSKRGAGGGSARYSSEIDGTSATNSLGYFTYGSGTGAGVTNRTEAAGGGGGGGLVVYRGSKTSPLRAEDVLVQGGDGHHGVAGADGVAGMGGSGFKIGDIPDSAIRDAIKSIYGVSDSDGMGGGGGGGGGTNDPVNVAYYGYGAGGGPGKGRDGGTDGDTPSATCATATGAAYARNGFGGGGGGGSIHAVLQSGGNPARNWLTRGGRGGDGLVAIHVRVLDRVVLPDADPVVAESVEAVDVLKIVAIAPEGADITAAEYTAYFKKVVTDTSGGKYLVNAELDEDVVVPNSVAAELASKFDDITATGVEVDAKSGLYYSVMQGSDVKNMTEGRRTMATGGKVKLKARKYDGSGFYKVMVNTTDK